MAVGRELLAKLQLDDGPLLTASEPGEKTMKESDGEGDPHWHGEAILRHRSVPYEPEYWHRRCMSPADRERGQVGRAERYQRERISRTDRRVVGVSRP